MNTEPLKRGVERNGRPSRSRGWIVFILGLLGIGVMLFVGFWGYARWANTLRPQRLPAPAAPSPNGYDRAALLVAKLPSEPVNRVSAWPYELSPQTRGVLPAARPVLDRIRATFKLQWRARPPMSLGQGIPELSGFRACTRYFVAESTLALERGDRSTAMQRRLDAMELASRIPRGGTILHALVGFACHDMGFARAEPMASNLPVSSLPDALVRVRRIRQTWPPFSEVLEGQRVTTHIELDDLARTYQHRNPFETVRFCWTLARWAPREQWSLWLTPKQTVRGNIDRYYRQAIAESKKPYRKRKAVPVPNDPVSRFGLMGNLELAEAKWWRVDVQLALLEVALAVRAHRLISGRYPDRLSQIDSQGLATVPSDVWGQPIVYGMENGRPLIYSLGPDGKDDGGRATRIQDLGPTTTGDIVFSNQYPWKL